MQLQLHGRWFWERRTAKGLLVAKGIIHNGIATGGINDAFEAVFRSGTQRTAWYASLIDGLNFDELASGDTMASHAGWQESTDYTQATRVQWSPGAAAAGKLINSSAMRFTMNAAKTIVGFFLCSVSTKGGTTGILWSTGEFDQPQSMPSGEDLKVVYSLTGQSGSP